MALITYCMRMYANIILRRYNPLIFLNAQFVNWYIWFFESIFHWKFIENFAFNLQIFHDIFRARQNSHYIRRDEKITCSMGNFWNFHVAKVLETSIDYDRWRCSVECDFIRMRYLANNGLWNIEDLRFGRIGIVPGSKVVAVFSLLCEISRYKFA